MSSIYSHHCHDQRVMMTSLQSSPPSHRHDTLITHHDTTAIFSSSSSSSAASSSPPSYYLTTGSNTRSYTIGRPPPPLPTITSRSCSTRHVVSTLVNSAPLDMQLFFPTTSPPPLQEPMPMMNDSYAYHDHPPSPPQQQSGRPYPCTICSRAFSRKHDLLRHSRVHTGVKPYICLACKRTFARTDALKRHLRMEDICRLSPEIQALKCAGKRRYKNL